MRISYRIVTAALCCFALIFGGCAKKDTADTAVRLSRASEALHLKAISVYQDLIARGSDTEQLRLQLGKLYFSRGEFLKAVEEFKQVKGAQGRKLLAISYYKMGNYADALEVFSQTEELDDEYLYYRGLTCERLNLFDQALEGYCKIKSKEFAPAASKRSQLIEKRTSALSIQSINPAIHAIISSAPLESKYPQAGALFLLCDESIKVTPQNTQQSSLHYLVKILNERGKEDFSEVHIDYDSTFEKVELEYARTIKPDGTVTEVGSRHMRDVSKYLNFPLYSNVRVFIISFPEVVEGACIEYKLKVQRNQLINKKDFQLSYPIQSSEPILDARLVIEVPEDKTIALKKLNEQYNSFGAELNPRIEKRAGLTRYSWAFKDIPQIIPEANMPAQVEINPTMLISTFKDWEGIYQWWWSLAKDKIKTDEAIRQKVKELTHGLKTEEEKIRALYNFCAQKIRYVAVEYGQGGHEPHKAADIYANKYGDCKDQAILLVSMLKEARIDAWPVLIATKEYYNLSEDFPAVFFNHCIAAVAVGKKTVFLDPTAETCSFGDLPAADQERRIFACKESGFQIESTPFYPAEHNLVKQACVIKIEGDEGIIGEKRVLVQGRYDQGQRYLFLYTPPELIKEKLEERIQEISIGATLSRYLIKNLPNLNEPTVLEYAFKGPEYWTQAGPLRIFPQLAGLDVSLVAKDTRRYPIEFDIAEEREVTYEIGLPPHFHVKYMPEKLVQDSPWIQFKVEYGYKDRTISFRQNIRIKKRLVAQEEYAAFKQMYETIAKKIKQKIIVERSR